MFSRSALPNLRESFLIMSNKDQSHSLALAAKASTSGAIAASTSKLFSGHVTPLHKSLSSAYEYSDSLSQAILSRDTNLLTKSISGLKNPALPSSNFKSVADNSIDEKLFNASSKIKVLTSQVAMHLDAKYRERLFSQIDALHDLDDWDPDDKPVQVSSFNTFLKTIIHVKPQRYPSLGLSYNGNLLGAWVNDKDRLTIEFLANDIVKWVLSKSIDGVVERSASQSPLSRLLERLATYHPESWFFTIE